MIALRPAAACFYDRLNAARNVDEIDGIVRGIWASYETELTDDECNFLTEAANNRRPLGRAASMVAGVVTMKPVGRLNSRLGSRFPRRKPQRSPDRKASRERQRMLGGAGHLPPQVRQHYTQGERAVLYVVSTECKRTGQCDWPIDKIAAMAGVSRTTAQNAMREARQLGHLSITERPVQGRKNLPNIVRIVSREWSAWIKRGPIGFKTFDPTKNIDIKKEGTERVERGVRGLAREGIARFRPPDTPRRDRRYASW